MRHLIAVLLLAALALWAGGNVTTNVINIRGDRKADSNGRRLTHRQRRISAGDVLAWYGAGFTT